jgi:hypothetical protein
MADTCPVTKMLNGVYRTELRITLGPAMQLKPLTKQMKFRLDPAVPPPPAGGGADDVADEALSLSKGLSRDARISLPDAAAL